MMRYQGKRHWLFNMRLWALSACCAVCAICLGCKPATGQAQAKPAQPGETTDPAAALMSAAERYWQAKEDENWAVVYEYLPPETVSDDMTPEKYAAWASANEPFVIHDWSITGPALVDGEFGWVEVSTDQSMRNIDVPGRKNTRWQIWHVGGGDWRPIPGKFAEHMPITPALRDRPSEDELRKRLQITWAARVADNWGVVFDAAHPDARKSGLIQIDRFEDEMSIADYLDYEIKWVEVRDGKFARSRIEYRYKVDDPSMRKAPPMTNSLVEYWVKVDGEWYWDVARGVGE